MSNTVIYYRDIRVPEGHVALWSEGYYSRYAQKSGDSETLDEWNYGGDWLLIPQNKLPYELFSMLPPLGTIEGLND